MMECVSSRQTSTLLKTVNSDWITQPLRAACVLLAVAVAAYGGSPKPRVVHDTPTVVVALHYDPRAAVDRQHPASIAPETIAAALRGLRVSLRDRLGLGTLRGQKNWTEAFTAAEAAGLAPYLSQALQQAAPHDVAAFYLVSRDARLGRVITSGGDVC